MKFFISLSIVIFMAQASYSQAFIAAVNQIPMNTEAIVVRTDGSIVEGKIRSSTLVNGFLKSFRVKDANENIHKFKSDEVLSIKVKPGLLGKLDMIAEKTSSIAEIVNTNFDEIIKREWIYFEQVISPKKNKKPLLLQQLNPGFDDVIKIYNNPGSQETSMVTTGETTIIGGEDRSYIALKSNGDSFFIRKGKYNKTILENFSDCEAFMDQFGSKKFKFRNIALHIFYYNQYCK
ncbi:MAG: hypothetical protein HQ541_15395 [Mariniphaga sp.]|nr:hypothetical protein [Mariniphaga sp.]